MKRISENLFVLEDTCNVYVIRDGREAVLIDFGSGEVLHHLQHMGIERAVVLLHTHHHRDQAQGDGAASSAGVPIHVPMHERHLFDQVETFWTTKQLYDMYNVRNTYFTLTRSVPVAGVLEDDGVHRFGNVEVRVLPTPGHTLGSVTILVRIDGALVAFVGDLLHSPGKVQTLYDMQYNYGAVDGVEATILSLGRLEEARADLLCPSHGQVMTDVAAALSLTKKNLRAFFRLQSGGQLAADEVDFVPVASRLLFAQQSCSSFYVLLSRDGRRALFVDFGAPNFGLFQPAARYAEPGERVRFVHHSLGRLREQYGVEKIEAVIPSHYHDDHINGIPYLQRSYGTELWAYENMKEILEHPAGELIGCIMPDPLRVARTFSDQERFSWEGMDFQVYFSPGHCDYHMSMFTTIDGKRIAFSGDNVWPPAFVPSLIYRNHVHRTSHERTALLYAEQRPEVLCTGHGLHTNVAPEGYDAFLANSRRLTELFDTLLPEDHALRGLEPSWIRIRPYQIQAQPGDVLELEVHVQNPHERETTVSWAWTVPEGWRVEPEGDLLTIAALASGKRPARLRLPSGYRFPHPKQSIALDVTLDGRRLGEVTEAVVEHTPYGASSPAHRTPTRGG